MKKLLAIALALILAGFAGAARATGPAADNGDIGRDRLFVGLDHLESFIDYRLS